MQRGKPPLDSLRRDGLNITISKKWYYIGFKSSFASRQCHRLPIMLIALEEQPAEIVKLALLRRDQLMTATRFHLPNHLSRSRACFGYAHFTVMANGFAETPPPMLERNAKNPSLL
jgi:hypothetical protein